MATAKADIEAKRHEVRKAYAAHGFYSTEYRQAFDELHDMNMAFMAAGFRKNRGLPPNATTPYCS